MAYDPYDSSDEEKRPLLEDRRAEPIKRGFFSRRTLNKFIWKINYWKKFDEEKFDKKWNDFYKPRKNGERPNSFHIGKRIFSHNIRGFMSLFSRKTIERLKNLGSLPASTSNIDSQNQQDNNERTIKRGFFSRITLRRVLGKVFEGRFFDEERFNRDMKGLYRPTKDGREPSMLRMTGRIAKDNFFGPSTTSAEATALTPQPQHLSPGTGSLSDQNRLTEPNAGPTNGPANGSIPPTMGGKRPPSSQLYPDRGKTKSAAISL